MFMVCVYFAAEMSLKRNGAATFDGKVDLFEYLISNSLF
jgi:hypothetical protein